jgi:NADH-quinone oxidoreductase subunit D
MPFPNNPKGASSPKKELKGISTNMNQGKKLSTGPSEMQGETRIQEMLLNMGPQHPATHGVLRMVLTLEGEKIVDCMLVIGYLHRGIEKILENRPYLGGIRYMDIADYLSPMLNEIAYVGAVEQVMGIEPPRRAQYIRILVGEMQRIASHLVATGSYLADLGAFTPILWCFRDREGILTLFEALGGSRFNVNYQRVGGVLHDFPQGWLRECEAYLDQLEKHMQELETLITGNEVFEARTQGVGYIPAEQAIAYGLTGPNARASGMNWDLRTSRPYMAYREVPINVQVRQEGIALLATRYASRKSTKVSACVVWCSTNCRAGRLVCGSRSPYALREVRPTSRLREARENWAST